MARPSSRPRKPTAPLSRAQGDDVLRYWLASLRLEEALQARPMARQAPAGAAVPRLDQPTPGQDYFKLPLDAAVVSLLAKQAQVTRTFDAELCGFFETWLHRQYRRSEDESELSHLLCFPVVHLPKGELAGLVRCGVRLRFGSGSGPAFQVPTRPERQRGNYPSAPDQVRVTRGAQQEGAFPFFIDTRLLRQPLGVPLESIDALFEALRSLETVSHAQMLAFLTVMLEGAASPNPEPESVPALAERFKAAASQGRAEVEPLLPRLTEAARRLLEKNGSRARVYPVGIVVDGTQAKTTWHLQRELEALVEGERSRWKVESPLGAYLTGKPRPASEEPQRALFPGPALTSSQRAAAEGFWGSSFNAVQGPPGTGKTRLILHLCAEHLVRQVEALLGAGRSNPGLLLITSSNNRAVDNVIDPLSSGDGLPLALRSGSRQVCEHQLLAQLRRTLSWLKRAEAEPQEERRERLSRAKAALRAPGEAFERQLAPRRAAIDHAAKRAKLEQELVDCALESADSELPVSKPHTHVLLFTLESLKNRLLKLSALCEAPASKASLQALERHFQKTSKRQLRAFDEALENAQLTLDLPLPVPASNASVEQQLEEWEEATELALARLGDLRAVLDRHLSSGARAERARRLRAQLEASNAEPGPEQPALEQDDQLSFTLFQAAVAAREAWASDRAAELVTAVSAAIRSVEQERSLRPLFRSAPEAAGLLLRLFGIWGSTLLSLGNCWSSDLGSVARVVIDEAGQCHPAHAVSALLRAESALVIGDVHQLSPVIELGADDEARLLRSCRLNTPAELLQPYRVHADAETSTQSLADRAVRERGTLTDHFRCQAEIIALSDDLCGYGLTVHTPRATRAREAPYLTHPVSLVDLRGEQTPLAGSWCNELELQETLALLESLLRAGIRLDEVAVITPYRGQLERLRRGLVERRIPLESSQELAEGGGLFGAQRAGVALGTVHRFQGGERSIVLFSSVVTHPASLGFLNARPNLLNVAISRAQHHFVCLGHGAALAQGSRSRLLTSAAQALSPAAYGGGLAPAMDLFGFARAESQS